MVVIAVVIAAVTVGVANANAATSYSGQASPWSVSAFGASVSIGDTGQCRRRADHSPRLLLDLNALGSPRRRAQRHDERQRRPSDRRGVARQRVGSDRRPVGDLVKVDVHGLVSGTTPSVSGSSELVNVTLLGLPISAPMPNVAIVAPGPDQVILNEQKSSVSGNTGSMTVNAIHVPDRASDIVLSSRSRTSPC